MNYLTQILHNHSQYLNTIIRMFSAKFNEEKEALEEHKQKLKDIIDACKLLYDNFDEKRREVSIFYPILNVMAELLIISNDMKLSYFLIL